MPIFNITQTIFIPHTSDVEIEATTAEEAVEIAHRNTEWFSNNGFEPNFDNADHRKYFLDVSLDGNYLGSTLDFFTVKQKELEKSNA